MRLHEVLKSLFVTVLVSGALSVEAAEQDLDAVKTLGAVLSVLDSEVKAERDVVQAYVNGLIAGMMWASAGREYERPALVCLPRDAKVTPGETIRMLRRFQSESEAAGNDVEDLAVGLVILRALAARYPCDE